VRLPHSVDSALDRCNRIPACDRQTGRNATTASRYAIAALPEKPMVTGAEAKPASVQDIFPMCSTFRAGI